ncbi:DUF4267 domain-containing protein [Rhizobium leguminosarum]|uniref:DUF4267 domain-containing protein n=1 Tax=Rhizobium leguminosarum TaxID=384 RepID=UPI001C95CBC9|nr:DUF4267 domain-containing protein [Rhizobium leguminosarum]MBY5746860.1 DUF4267 domain-containing protein [Rhizobium leguminosarum]
MTFQTGGTVRLRCDHTWKKAAGLLGFALAALGILILVSPAVAAPLFASGGVSEANATYIRAIAVRDIAVGLWLLVGPTISVGATTISLVMICLIPLGDLVLVWSAKGDLLSLLPHMLSLTCLIILALWGSRIA